MQSLHVASVVAIVTLAGVVPFVVSPAPADTEASITRVGTWQAPENATALDDATDVRSAIGDGTLTRATGVTRDDVLIIGVEIRGFEGAVSDADGSNTTEQFLSALSEHGNLTVEQTNPGPSQLPAYVHVLEETGVRVFSDAANDTYYLAVDLGEVRVTRGEDGEEVDLAYGPYPFIVRAELAADSPLTEERQLALAPVESRTASVETDPDGGVHVQPTSNQTISGTTNVGTGWNVTVVLAGSDDSDTAANESFRLTQEATVELPDDVGFYYGATFDSAFDFRTVPVGAERVTVDVQLDGTSLLDVPVPVAVADRRASVAVDGIREGGEFTGVTANATLSAGGFLVLHEESADGPVVGHTAYLDPGEQTVTVYANEPTDADEVVVVAHRDSNHNEWFDGPDVDPAYTEDDPDDAVALDSTNSLTPTGTTTTPSPDDATAASPTDSTPTGVTTPGFGAVTAVIALLVVLAAIGRR